MISGWLSPGCCSQLEIEPANEFLSLSLSPFLSIDKEIILKEVMAFFIAGILSVLQIVLCQQ